MKLNSNLVGKARRVLSDVSRCARLAASGFALFGCSSVAMEQEQESDLNSLSEELDAPMLLSYRVVPDLRKCVWPLCGGYYVSAVNRRLTRCADGSLAASCYVASIDWTRMGGDPQLEARHVVVEGLVEPAIHPPFGNLGVLVAENAWGSATDQDPKGVYFGLADNGLVCITEPCFSIDAKVLNRPRMLTLSGLDLTRVGASEKQIDQAREALLEGKLLASGKTVARRFPTGRGLDLHASQFFLPVPEPGRCSADEECPAERYCNAAEVCLPPDCVPGEPCIDVCTGFCVPK